MRRRDLSKALLATVATTPDSLASAIQARAHEFAEQAAGIVPENPAFPFGDLRRYGGDPTGTGGGGSDKPDLQAEFNDAPHVRGTCSMARTNNPHSANSQFFICLDDARFLDKQYTVWGEVESGMEHVDALPKGEPPRTPGKIVKATVG